MKCLVLAIAAMFACSATDGFADDTASFRVLSWNISGDAFVAEPDEFQELLQWADPDVVLLDEVSPSADLTALQTALASLRAGHEQPWHISVGASGGRQRNVIASRYPIEALPEFSGMVPYPQAGRARVLALVPPEKQDLQTQSMDSGIAINGAVVFIDDRRLLVLSVDMTCCGNGPESWEEVRRRVEAQEIRRLLRSTLMRVKVDGIVFTGDFNLVESTFPMALLTGPYPSPHGGLIPAELYHPDGVSTWTWDGRNTPFPSNSLDYQLYGPQGLVMRSGFILDNDRVERTGRHRPLLVEYQWSD